jgi:peroxiredoxin
MKLKAGDSFPTLTLKNLHDKDVQLPDRGKIVHLQFRRYAGCPICNLHLRSFASRINEIEKAGIREVVVFHSSVEAMLPYQGSLTFDAIADPEKKLYKQFGVESSPRSIMSLKVLLEGMKGMKSTKPTSKREGGPFGLPAEFLIAPNGQIMVAHYGKHAADHWSVDQLLAGRQEVSASVPAMAG